MPFTFQVAIFKAWFLSWMASWKRVVDRDEDVEKQTRDPERRADPRNVQGAVTGEPAQDGAARTAETRSHEHRGDEFEQGHRVKGAQGRTSAQR
jgi:hypothetical protein